MFICLFVCLSIYMLVCYSVFKSYSVYSPLWHCKVTTFIFGLASYCYFLQVFARYFLGYMKIFSYLCTILINKHYQWKKLSDLSGAVNSPNSISPGSPRCQPGVSSGSGWISIHASAVFSVSLAALTRRRKFSWSTPNSASRDLALGSGLDDCVRRTCQRALTPVPGRPLFKRLLISNKRHPQMLIEALAIRQESLFASRNLVEIFLI